MENGGVIVWFLVGAHLSRGDVCSCICRKHFPAIYLFQLMSVVTLTSLLPANGGGAGNIQRLTTARRGGQWQAPRGLYSHSEHCRSPGFPNHGCVVPLLSQGLKSVYLHAKWLRLMVHACKRRKTCQEH